jgi:SOS-response transcriptional repressor LexA
MTDREYAAVPNQNDQIREWLRDRLDERGHGARQALARHLGLERPDAITRMLNTDPKKETRLVKAHELEAMREFFGDGKKAKSADERPVPTGSLQYGGKVSAGAWQTEDDFNQDVEGVPPTIPRHAGYPKLPQVAWKVAGNSMNERGIVDGMWAVGVSYIDWVDHVGELTNGDLVVVERRRAQDSERELTVKEVQFARRGMRLVPRSTDPSYKEFFVDLDESADPEVENIRITGVVLWYGMDADPRAR